MDAVKYHTRPECARQGREIGEVTTVMLEVYNLLSPAECYRCRRDFTFNRSGIKAPVASAVSGTSGP